MNEIVMPKLSDTMTEGRLVSWKKRVGDTVRRGDVLAEVETDKANMELEAFTSGVLLEIRVQAGEMAEVGTVIAVIGKAEEKGAQAPAAKEGKPVQEQAPKEEQPAQASAAKGVGPAQAAQEQPAQPEATPEAPAQPAPEAAAPKEEGGAAGVPPPAGAEEVKAGAEKPGGMGERQAPAAPVAEAGEAQPAATPGGGGEQVPGTTGGAKEEHPATKGRAEARPAETAAVPAGGVPGEGGAAREKAAPVVRRKARELGVDLSQVKGSGPEGRILLQDLEGHGTAPGERPETAQAPAGEAAPAAGPAPGQEETKPMPRLRAAVAKIVSESWDTIPHFTVTMDVVMDDAESIRRQLKQLGKAVTVNDLIVKGVSLALQKFPQLNASFTAEGVKLHGDVNIGVAVGVPDGVLVPVVRGCQRLSLLEIAQQTRGLVEKARSGGLNEQDMGGGTFSVSNMGMYGVTQFSAIIYPHQAGVLAVGAVMETAMACAGITGSRKVMKVTLSADHRLVDGAYAAEFLVEFKSIMETPVRLLID